MYCRGNCDTCQECDKIPKSDPAYFSCFDCTRYPPAYRGATCGDLGDETVAGIAADAICAGQSADTALVGLVDAAGTFRRNMTDFYSFDYYDSTGDPMGRYRTKENENYRGRVRSCSCEDAPALFASHQIRVTTACGVQGLWDYTFKPRIPDDMHIDPYTGVITWETGISPYNIDDAPYPDPLMPRPTGLAADASQRSAYSMLQPRSLTSPQGESGASGFYEAVMDSRFEKEALLDVIFNAAGGYNLAAARCHAAGESTAPDSTCMQGTPTRYEDLTADEVRRVYQGSRAYEDIYCQTQQGYAGVWGSQRHYRTAQGCIRGFPSAGSPYGTPKKPAAPGIYPISVVAYSKSHDAFGEGSVYNASDARAEGMSTYGARLSADDVTMLNDQAYVKTTISLNVYLYPAMHYCARGCDNYEALKKGVEQWEADPESIDSALLMLRDLHALCT